MIQQQALKPSIKEIKVKRLFDSVELSKEYHTKDRIYRSSIDETLKQKLNVLNSYNKIKVGKERLSLDKFDYNRRYDFKNELKKQASEIM